MINKKTLLTTGLAGALSCALPIKDSQAAIVTTVGDRDSILELELKNDRFNINLSSTYDFDLFYIPFLNNEDASKVTINFSDLGCVVNGNYFVCTTFGNIKLDSISGSFTLPSGYEFGEFMRSAGNSFYSSNSLYFESFYANIPSIKEVTTQSPTPQVSAPVPGTLLGIGLAGVLAINGRRRRKKNN